MATLTMGVRSEKVSERFFDWRFRPGLREIPSGLSGLHVRIENQPTQNPDYVDVRFRDGKVQRLLRVRLSWLQWIGPRP